MIVVIEDELHADPQGGFCSIPDAIAELRRRARIPWNEKPNLAPCSNWAKCGRTYSVVEYDDTSALWQEIRRTTVLKVCASGVRWSPGFADGATAVP